MSWRHKLQGVVITDLRKSTKPILGAATTARRTERFFNEVLEPYRRAIVAALEGSFVGSSLEVVSTGDGFAIVVTAEDAARVAWLVQVAADRFADDALRDGERHGFRLVTDGFHFQTGIGVATGSTVFRDDHAAVASAPVSLLPVQADGVTGPAFNVAARLCDKARDQRAVLSPLLDKRTVRCSRQAQAAAGLQFFYVGDYRVNTKTEIEAPRGPRDIVADLVPLYSIVSRGSVVAPIAEAFECAVRRHLAFERAKAIICLRDLDYRIDLEAERIREELGRVALDRWRRAVRRFAYAFSP